MDRSDHSEHEKPSESFTSEPLAEEAAEDNSSGGLASGDGGAFDEQRVLDWLFSSDFAGGQDDENFDDDIHNEADIEVDVPISPLGDVFIDRILNNHAASEEAAFDPDFDPDDDNNEIHGYGDDGRRTEGFYEEWEEEVEEDDF